VTRAFEEQPSVKRIALFGSVASPPTIEPCGRWRGHIHEPKDVDLAVWLDPVGDLDLCGFNQCPKHKPECRVPGCGEVPFLRHHEGFEFDAARSLRPDRVLVLFERR
jgi:hypothetical protein